MDNLRGLLGIRRMDRVANIWIRELFGVTKVVDEMIEESVLRWFGHVKRMESDKIVKSLCRRYAGSRSVGRSRKTGLTP